MIDAAIDAADRYFPAFDYLIRGGSSPRDSIDACLFETAGTA